MIGAIFGISVYLVTVAGDMAATHEQAVAEFQAAAVLMEAELGIRLRLVKARRLPRYPFTAGRDIAGKLATAKRFVRWFNGKQYGANVIKIALVPPIWESPSYYLWGVSRGICSYRNAKPIVICSDTYSDSDGNSLFSHAVTCLMHEAGHSLGAFHDSSLPASTMHPFAFYHVFQNGRVPLSYSDRSKAEIEECLR